jgi:8-oxo-dGTP diphosphatase
MKKIYKVAAVVIEDDKFLMVRKTGKDIWTNLGGKPEAGESEEGALIREVKEELNCKAVIKEKLGEFENKAAFDDAIIHISFFLVELVGNPVISDEELEEFKFIGEADLLSGVKLPLTITEQLVPLLIKKSYLKWEEK